MRFFMTLAAVFFATFAFAKIGTDITYNVDGTQFEGYWVQVDKKAPLVLIVHDWDGVTDYEKKRAEMLGELGYNTFAIDIYGKGIRPTETADKKKMATSLYQDRDTMRKRLFGGLNEAKARGGNLDNALIAGYCFGGTAVLELARAGADLKAFIPFHGGLSTPEDQDYSKTKGQILVFHGSADTSVTIDEFAALVKELEAAKIPHEMITYSGAPHAFSIFGSERYRKDADEKSWTRFVEFLDAALEK